MSSVDEIIKRMLAATAAVNQADMLRILGFPSGLASQWKKRGNVPDGSIAMAATMTGVSFEWIKTGEGEMRSAGEESPLDRELLNEAIITIGMAEDELGIRLKPEKRSELIMMIYDEYSAGVKVEPAKVIQLVKLAA